MAMRGLPMTSSPDNSANVIIPAQVPESLHPCLVLRVKRKYYDQIRSGEKKVEYREIKDYWTKRLVDRKYAAIVIANRQSTRFKDPEWLIFPWNGYLEYPFGGAEDIFGSGEKEVYAIPLILEQMCRDNPALSA